MGGGSPTSFVTQITCFVNECIPPVSGHPGNPKLSGLLLETQGIPDLVHRWSQLHRCVMLYIRVHLYTPRTYCMYSAHRYVHLPLQYLMCCTYVCVYYSYIILPFLTYCVHIVHEYVQYKNVYLPVQCFIQIQ